MIGLRVILDQLVAEVPGGIGRYTEELTRHLIARAPDGCAVEGIISRVSDQDLEKLTELLPGLTRVRRLAMPRAVLAQSWRAGLTLGAGRGMIHAPSLLAPMRRHDRTYDKENQVVVTIHDTVPFSHPETLTRNGANWHRAMIRRAWKYADAVVTPTHAVAAELSNYYDFGDRIRVIGGAVRANRPDLLKETDKVVDELDLPERYVLVVGTLEPRKGLEPLIAAMTMLEDSEIPLVIVGPAGWGGVNITDIAEAGGLSAHRVRLLGYLDDAALAVVQARATVFAAPSFAEGFGLPLLEAMQLGTPAILSDAPALVEVAGGSGMVVPRADLGRYPALFAEALDEVLGNDRRREEMSIAGRDRAGVFSWDETADKVWQLHADL